ncbi:hypothetical protein GPL26_03435 [Enterocloster citroniae]|uniref:Uncharacterized protein n=1 Tax=Enterocloster citroniae TaxID=358743 RepID=A0AA41FBJ3_9FIRM|nr:hypothetical protein [Enterocloster citroniae]MBT9808695.1 hypothetical protein [Enterocloster citroniae]
MNFLREELKKILGMTQYREEAVYVGNCGYVRVNEDVRMRLEFSRSSTTTYDGIAMTMFNRKEGTIDINTLKFRDIWGEKTVIKPNFREEGIIPHIWEKEEKEWYVYQPNQREYQMLADETNQYVGLFQEAEITQEPQMNM